MDVKLSLKLSKAVHEICDNVPHDIGITLERIVREHQTAQLQQHGVSGKQPDENTIRATAINYSEKHREHDRWMKIKYYCFKDFQAGAQWALSQVACATAKGKERKD